MTCSLCEKPAYVRGWCKMHHTRWLRHGDPNVVRSDRASNPAYRTIHSRLTKRRGKASDYLCVDCKQPARDWSYKNGSGDMPYSTNLDDYEPRCRSCHINLDKPSRPACSADSCDKPYYAKGLCQSHYEKQRYALRSATQPTKGNTK